jgi:F-type H+-transporting ATPase subunit b
MLAVYCLVVPVGVVRAEDPPAEKAAAEAHAAGDHAAGGHAGGEHKEPTPFDEWKSDLPLFTLITFLAFLFVLKKIAWKPMIEGLDKREAKIFGALSEAEVSRQKAAKLLEQHQQKLDKVQDQVREILAEARRDAETTKNDIIATAQKEAEATRKRAIVDIERARDAALDDLFDHMEKAVGQATQTVVGRSLTGADHDRLIRESLAEFTNQRG